MGAKPQIENGSSVSRYGYGGFLWEPTLWAMGGGFLWEPTLWAMGVEHALVSPAL